MPNFSTLKFIQRDSTSGDSDIVVLQAAINDGDFGQVKFGYISGSTVVGTGSSFSAFNASGANYTTGTAAVFGRDRNSRPFFYKPGGGSDNVSLPSASFSMYLSNAYSYSSYITSTGSVGAANEKYFFYGTAVNDLFSQVDTWRIEFYTLSGTSTYTLVDALDISAGSGAFFDAGTGMQQQGIMSATGSFTHVRYGVYPTSFAFTGSVSLYSMRFGVFDP